MCWVPCFGSFYEGFDCPEFRVQIRAPSEEASVVQSQRKPGAHRNPAGGGSSEAPRTMDFWISASTLHIEGSDFFTKNNVPSQP